MAISAEQSGIIAVPQSQEGKKRGMTRRDFLKESVRAAAWIVGGPLLLTLEGSAPQATALKPARPTAAATTSEILDRIKRQYDIEIPLHLQSQYNAGEQYVTIEDQEGFRLTGNGEITTLTTTEAEVIKESLSKIPSPGALIQLILPYRFGPTREDIPNIPHGFYYGRVWDQWLNEGPSVCKNNPDRPVDARAAMVLLLPDNFSPDTPLPQPFSFAPFIPGAESLNQPEEIPRTTQGEYVRQVIIHEQGHAFIDQVSWKAWPTPREHCQKRDTDVMSLCGFTNMVADDPVLKTFSTINGWKLVPHSEILASCNIKSKGEDRRSGWVRDPEIWGSPTRLRISQLASLGDVEEAFAEFFMAYILYPGLLTPQETQYFDNIKRGMEQNPQDFFQQIARDPQILLKGIDLKK